MESPKQANPERVAWPNDRCDPERRQSVAPSRKVTRGQRQFAALASRSLTTRERSLDDDQAIVENNSAGDLNWMRERLMEPAIRARTLNDDEAIVEIRNQVRVSLPPSSVARYRFKADSDLKPAGSVEDRFVAELDGRVVGHYFLGGNWFFERAHTLVANLTVRRHNWGQGIGTALYRHLLERALRQGTTLLYCDQVAEGDLRSRIFAERRGFVPSGQVERYSRLEVARANFEGYEGLRIRLAREGIEIRTISEAGVSDTLLRRLHHLEHEAGKDMPASDRSAKTPFEIWRRWLFEAPDQSPDRVWIALAGDRPVGMAVLETRGLDTALNGFTGTAPEHRNRGIARALKQSQIEWCGDHGVAHIYTSNDSTNERMLAINIRLGYKPVASQIEMTKTL